VPTRLFLVFQQVEKTKIEKESITSPYAGFKILYPSYIIKMLTRNAKVQLLGIANFFNPAYL